MHRIMDRVFIFCSFLSWCGVLITFDLVFLYVGVFFQGGPGVSYVLVVLSFVLIGCRLLE